MSMRMITVVFLFWLALWVAAVHAADSELVAKAKTEKTLSWYSSTASDDARALISGFNKLYPGLEVRQVRGGSERVLTRLEMEARTGVLLADVIDINGFYGGALLERGYWIPYLSPHGKDYPPELKDTKGRWVSTFLLTLVPSFNTRLVAPETAPKSWEEFLHPKWKGKLAVVDSAVLFYGGIKSYLGEERGERYLQALRSQQPEVVPDFTLALQQLVAGEHPILLTTYGHRVEQFIAKGAPVDWVKSDVVFVMPQIIGVTGRGKSPNAAKLWVDFLISQQGQKILQELRRIPAHPNVDPIPARLTRGVKLHYVRVTERADEHSRFLKRYREIMR